MVFKCFRTRGLDANAKPANSQKKNTQFNQNSLDAKKEICKQDKNQKYPKG